MNGRAFPRAADIHNEIEADSIDAENELNDAQEVWQGLNGVPKRLPCRFLYDDAGSKLFERICGLPEYYLARAEIGILKQYRYEMLEDIGPKSTVVEWGSGASLKTRLLLDALIEPRVYVPIDISRAILMRSAQYLAGHYPALDVRPIAKNYLQPHTLPLSESERERPIIGFLPGSTLGNFEPDEAVEFLATVRAACGKRQRLIVGTDLEKAPQLIEAAYNDIAGLTAEFNRNVLAVVNRRFGGNFDTERFAHSVIYRAKHHRLEMRLVSMEQQTVSLPQGNVSFALGEPLVTEHAYKFSIERLDLMASRAGFEVTRSWTDPQRLFSVQILRPF